MSTLQNIEQNLVKLHKQLPFNLPESWRKWLANNSWWLVIVGIVITILSIIGAVRSLFWAESVLRSARQLAEAFGVSAPGASITHDISLWVSVATLAVVVLIQLRSIQLLRDKKKAGWDLLFLAAIISLAGSLISNLLVGSIAGSIITLIIAAAISWFVLFEIRGQFLPINKKSKDAHSSEFKPAAHE